jgi:hypothetical protein
MSIKHCFVLVVCVAATSSAATAFATSAIQRSPVTVERPTHSPVEAVTLGHVPQPGTVAIAGARGRSKILFREFQATVKPGQEDGGLLTCPKSAPQAISGYFTADNFGQVTLTNSFPNVKNSGKARSWDVGVRSISTEDQTYYGGVVCIS